MTSRTPLLLPTRTCLDSSVAVPPRRPIPMRSQLTLGILKPSLVSSQVDTQGKPVRPRPVLILVRRGNADHQRDRIGGAPCPTAAADSADVLQIVRTRKLFWKQADAEQVRRVPSPITYSLTSCSSTASIRVSPPSSPASPADRCVGRFYFPRLVQHAVSGPSTFLALYGPDALQKWRDLIGPTHFYKTQWTQPETLRSRYGLSDTRNGFHGSDSDASAKKECVAPASSRGLTPSSGSTRFSRIGTSSGI